MDIYTKEDGKLLRQLHLYMKISTLNHYHKKVYLISRPKVVQAIPSGKVVCAYLSSKCVGSIAPNVRVSKCSRLHSLISVYWQSKRMYNMTCPRNLVLCFNYEMQESVP